MTAKTKLVCLHNIDAYFHGEPENKKTAEQIKDAEYSKKSRIISFVLEESGTGQYFLVENFQLFMALKKTNSYLRVPCLVYPAISEKERLLHILKISIPLEKLERDVSWPFYHEHVMRLMNDHYLTIEDIAKRTNCSKPKIKSFTLDERSPSHIREIAVEMRARTTVQSICSSRVILETMKRILYEKAVLDTGHLYKLTSEKFKHFTMLCKRNHIPARLLYNEFELEQFINELLSTNFNLNEHFDSLISFEGQHNASEWSIFLK